MQTTLEPLESCSVVFLFMAQSNVRNLKPNQKIKPGAEFVTGAPYFTDQPRVLPQYDETLIRHHLTHEQVDVMLTDPDVYAALMLLVLMALNEKLLITPAITAAAAEKAIDLPANDATDPAQQPASATDPTKSASTAVTDATPDNAKDNVPATNAVDSTENAQAKPIDPKIQRAADIAAFCERQINRVPKFASIMFQMVYEGLAHGNKIAEQVLEISQRGEDAGRWCLKGLKPKPREAIAFVVDAFMNEIGFIGAKPGQITVTHGSLLVSDEDLLPREKFAVFTYRPKDNDPRGVSALIAARNGWELKQRTFPEYLLFLMVSAIPGILATLAAGSDEVTLYEDDGVTAKKDADGEVITISAHQFLLNMLGKMRNHQVGVAPEGTEFTLLEANSDGEVFTRGLDKFGSEITMAILFQQLATRDSKHQSKAATGSQAHVIDYIVWWIRDTAADMVRYDILKSLVRYNFGDEDADELLPKTSYGDTEARDWAVDANAASALFGKVTDSQWEHITTQLGIPAPTDGERKLKLLMKQVMLRNQNNAPGDNPADQNKDNKPGDNEPAKK